MLYFFFFFFFGGGGEEKALKYASKILMDKINFCNKCQSK